MELYPNINQRIIKYLLFGFIIGISLRYIPEHVVNNTDILIIAFIASISFAIIDINSPTIKVT